MTGTDDVVNDVRRDLRRLESLCADTEHPLILVPLGAPEPRPAGFVGPMPQAVRRVRVTSSRLLTEAVATGDDPDMPGGDAMVALALVSNVETWGYKLDNAEQDAEAIAWRTGAPLQPVEQYDDDKWEPPLQTLLYWSNRWRRVHDMEFEPTPNRPRQTVASEVNFLRWAIDWAVQNEPRFKAFTKDVEAAKTRAENLLHDGVRSDRGVPCLYEECKGKRLVRKLVPGRDEDGEKVWFYSPWHCPSCHREWNEDRYAAMKTAAAEATKIEHIDSAVEDDPGDTWCSVEYAAHRTGRPAATIRVWAHRGRVASVCLLAGRRRGYVRVTDVDEQHALAERCAAAVRAGKRRKKGTPHVL